MEVVASLSQGRTAAAQCCLFTHKSVPVIFEPPCNFKLFRFQTFCTSDIRMRTKVLELYYSGDAVCDGYSYMSRYHDYTIKGNSLFDPSYPHVISVFK